MKGENKERMKEGDWIERGYLMKLKGLTWLSVIEVCLKRYEEDTIASHIASFTQVEVLCL